MEALGDILFTAIVIAICVGFLGLIFIGLIVGEEGDDR